jgi:hypothetical protein
MSTKNEIQNVINTLKQRDTSLYLACQLIDFYSFLSIGKITVKEQLEKANMPYAPYKTNEFQKANGFWDAHILHLMDYGAQFYRKAQYLPNLDGPVLFHIKPEILMTAKSVSMTHMSVKKEQFSRQSHLLSLSTDEVNHCFKHDISASFPEKTLLKDELIQKSGTDDMVPEIICHFDQTAIPFSYVSLVSVDHYIINNRQFQSWLDEIKLRAGFTFPLMRRYCPSSTALHITSEMGKLLLNGPVTSDDIIHSKDERLQAWGTELKQNQLIDLLDIYTNHLQSDTLLPLYHGDISAEKIDQLSKLIREKDQIIDQISEKDALSILKELATTNPGVFKQIKSMQRNG